MQFNNFHCSYYRNIKETRNGTTTSIRQFPTDVENPSKPENEIINLYRRTGNVWYKIQMPADVWAASTNTGNDDAIDLTYGLMVVDYHHGGSASDVCRYHFEPCTPDVLYSPYAEESAQYYISKQAAEELTTKNWHNQPVWAVGLVEIPDHPFLNL